ncbi:MAG TPA: dUTP diphosphatase, partial [Candidatus Pacebacteria bacterium]|nr:dUTP diphosphatase [Candidatus Paceibacterota bacterium]
MQIKLKLFDPTLPMPAYKTTGAAAMDLYARVEVVIPAHKVGYVPLNIALQLPPDHWAQISARSSLHKKGLILANGIGVGDYDYRGDGDEYL